MRASARMAVRTQLPLLATVWVLIATLSVSWPGLAPAEAADPRLEKAQEQVREAQGKLDEIYQRLWALESEVEQLEAEITALEAQQAAYEQEAAEASSTLAARIRDSYIRGSVDPSFALLNSGSVQEAREQARLLGMLALQSRGEVEAASAARIRTEVTATEIDFAVELLRERRAEVDGARQEAAHVLAEAQDEEEQVRAVLAAEERERREREERERREREERERRERERVSRTQSSTSTTGGGGGGDGGESTGGGSAQQAATPSGGIACPIGQPRSYSDTWGAPRSGGRGHLGTDIMAPHGTPIFAYENGVITRLTNSRLGGISLYLRGDSGNLYYYAHLQGYVGGVGGGQQVSAGQHIAFNGDTGNARGIPHLHFEVKPGGGGNVNPYPFVRQACG